MKITHRLLLVPILMIGAHALAQPEDSPWLIKFDNGRTVSKADFEHAYQKNNGGWKEARNASQKDYREYLELFINFKRKVMAAEAEGLDTTKSFKNELKSYVKQLSQPYLIEKGVLEKLIKEAYERSKKAVKVSHILVKVDENAPPSDTLRAYRKAMAYRDSIVKHGKDFGHIARQYSEDPGAQRYDGYLSWFTAFDFLYNFETAAYNADVGAITQPVRTRFGYHLIKVHDKKRIQGNPRLSHILVRIGPNYVAKDTAQAKARLDSIQDALAKGRPFAEVARKFSDDPQSRRRGGDLGTRYIGVPQLQDLRYELEEGEVSEPVTSDFGFHIAKLTEIEPIKSFEEMQSQLKNRVSNDSRAKLAEEKFLNKLRDEYNFERNEANINKIAASVDKKYVQSRVGKLDLPQQLYDLPLFSFADQRYSFQDLVNALPQLRRQRPKETDPEKLFRKELDEFEGQRLMAYEETQLSRKYPEFRRLKQEYRDGILLFSLTEKKVWQKAVKDSAGLRNYYETHKTDFPAGERVRVIHYTSRDSQVLASVLQVVREKGVPEADSMIQNNDLAVRRSVEIFPKDDNKEAKMLYELRVGQHTPINKESVRFQSYVVDEFLPEGYKTFEEAKAQAITQYQELLEERWHAELAERYPYQLNKKAFNRLFE